MTTPDWEAMAPPKHDLDSLRRKRRKILRDMPRAKPKMRTYLQIELEYLDKLIEEMRSR